MTQTMRERLIAVVKSIGFPEPRYDDDVDPNWADGIVDAILAELRTPDEGMVAAGKKADWVGEIEGRAGKSIRPTSMAALAGYVPDHPPFAEMGIWAAMIDTLKP